MRLETHLFLKPYFFQHESYLVSKLNYRDIFLYSLEVAWRFITTLKKLEKFGFIEKKFLLIVFCIYKLQDYIIFSLKIYIIKPKNYVQSSSLINGYLAFSCLNNVCLKRLKWTFLTHKINNLHFKLIKHCFYAAIKALVFFLNHIKNQKVKLIYCQLLFFLHFITSNYNSLKSWRAIDKKQRVE